MCSYQEYLMIFTSLSLHWLHRSDVGTSESVTVVMSALRLLLLLEHLRPTMLRELPTSAKLVRLMCVFLIGGEALKWYFWLWHTYSYWFHRKQSVSRSQYSLPLTDLTEIVLSGREAVLCWFHCLCTWSGILQWSVSMPVFFRISTSYRLALYPGSPFFSMPVSV